MLKVLKMVPGIAACIDVTVDTGVTVTVVWLAYGKMPVIGRGSAQLLGVDYSSTSFCEDVGIDMAFEPDDVAKMVKHFEAVFALPIEQRQAYLEMVKGDLK